MIKHYIKRISSVALGLALAGLMIVPSADAASGGVELTNSDVTPFASKKVGGGTWSYGITKNDEKKTKTVYSKYWHPSKNHGSSAQLGSRKPNRSCVKKDKESNARQTAVTSDTGYAYWNTTCKPK